MKKLIILLVLLGLAVNLHAQSEPDVTVIPDNTRFNSRIIVERRSTNRTPSQSGAGSIWFNTGLGQWFGDTGTSIFNFGSGSGGTPTFGNQNANTVFSGPASGGPATPGFRILVAADIPALNTVASGLVSGTCVRVVGGFLASASSDCSVTNGTVTSFASNNLSPLFTTSVTNSTTTPVLSFSLSSQSQNLFFASPNGSSGNPAFRAIVSADVPNLDAAKITSGIFDSGRIPDLDAAKIISGTFAAARIPALSALSGAVTDAQVPNLSGLGTGLSDGCVESSGGFIISTGLACGTGGGGGGGITTLNGLTNATQAFVNDTNVTMVSSGSNHTITWAGTLAAARLNSNVVQSVVNDTNVTGTISAQALTIGWTGALAKARQHAATVYNDQANTFASGFAQKFSGIVELDAVSPAEITVDQDDYAGCDGKAICRTTQSVNILVSSIASPGSRREFTWVNVDDGTETVTFINQASTGTASLRIITPDDNNLVIAPKEAARFSYDNDSSRWRVWPLRVQSASSVPPLEQIIKSNPGTSNVVSDVDCTSDKAIIIKNDVDDQGWICWHATQGFRLIPVVDGVQDVGNKTTYVRDGYVVQIENVATGDVPWKVDPTTKTITGSAVKKSVQVELFDPTTDVATGDGKRYFYIPVTLNGYSLTAIQTQVVTAGTTNTTDVDVDKCNATTSGNVCSGTVVSMLTTKPQIQSGENTSDSGTAGVVNSSNAAVSTGQVLRFNVDAINTTAPKGLVVNLDFTAPQ